MTFRELFAELVKRKREERMLSQSDLADICGVSRTTITNIESATQGCTFECALIMSRVLGIKLDSLPAKRIIEDSPQGTAEK